jgi:hypothetical protein
MKPDTASSTQFTSSVVIVSQLADQQALRDVACQDLCDVPPTLRNARFPGEPDDICS